MTAPTAEEKAAAALKGPQQRPRTDKAELPKPPGSTPNNGSNGAGVGGGQDEDENKARAAANAETERLAAEKAAAEAAQLVEDEANRRAAEKAAVKAEAERIAAAAEAQRQADEAAATAARRQAAGKARRQLAARNAEQTFLPLLSRVAKLREWVEQAGLAIEDAIEQGVDPGLLEDTLKSIARKNDVPFEDIPESVRKAVSGALSGP